MSLIKLSVPVTIAGVFLFSLTSLPSFASQGKIEDQMRGLNGIFGLEFEKNQTAVLNGTLDRSSIPCEVTVYNRTAISSTFPQSSKDSQSIQVSILADRTGVNFKLNRTSLVSKFDLQRTTGAAQLSIRASNRTEIGNGRMDQEIEIVRGSNGQDTVEVSITDFNGDKLVCNAKRSQ